MDAKEIKKYHSLKLWIPLIESLLYIILVMLTVFTQVSVYLEEIVYKLTTIDIIAFFAFVCVYYIAGFVISFPFSFYIEYKLEKKYKFSNQSLRDWIIEKLKAIGVGILIGVPILIVFYYVLVEFQNLWWLPVGFFLFLFSFLITKIAPSLIFPIFFKFVPLEDVELKEKLISLCNKYNFNVDGVFKFDLSKKTKKANAAFAGLGKSKKIILSDTLLENFNKDEIISIFAHELGHYKLNHLIKMILSGFAIMLVGLWLASELYDYFISILGFGSLTRLSALPLLGVILSVYSFITSPLINMISRKYEYEADKFALRVVENKGHFITALKKLSELNAIDINPNPVVEFLFYDHPSVSKRINLAENFNQ